MNTAIGSPCELTHNPDTNETYCVRNDRAHFAVCPDLAVVNEIAARRKRRPRSWVHVFEVYDSARDWQTVAVLSFDVTDITTIVSSHEADLAARELLFGFRGAERFALGTRSYGTIAIDAAITHRLKTERQHWDAINDGRKTAELRLNDRDYRVGDQLILERGTDDARHLTLAPRHHAHRQRTAVRTRPRVRHALAGPMLLQHPSSCLSRNRSRITSSKPPALISRDAGTSTYAPKTTTAWSTSPSAKRPFAS